ncbi:type VII secretion protein EccE [Mycolicibacterium tusciae]|uniref:type VII secretion protein EccE n=1 Tax=Mycolicibacterium tusciae TaxID=75922 RepID=UPI00024A46C6|nr:type VII secretion protein EccE [Mycolicibacterium tusciae]
MTIRIGLALLFIVPAAMTYPWDSDIDRWIVGVAIGVTLFLFAWWRGVFVTNMISRRCAIWRRNHSTPRASASNDVTLVLHVDDPAGVGLPLPLVAGYVERFGVRSQNVRVTNRGERGVRTTWITITLSAADNLAALRARSPELPLHDTAEIVGRRLVDHLRETGLSASIVDDAPKPLAGRGREKWRGVSDDNGLVSAYRIPVDDNLAERFAEVWSQSIPTWTAIEFSGTSAHPTVSALCAFRTAEAERGAPVAGLTPAPGIQWPLLTALDPASADRLDIPSAPLPPGLLEPAGWLVGGRWSVEHEVTHEASHPA